MAGHLLVGYAAVFGAIIAFGSFGVPIKSPTVLRARVHPLVFQSYKTFWVLASCPLALLFSTRLQFTWWGVVSGLFWVPGGICAVVSVTNVGLAVGQGVWSCLIVIVAFSWGAFVFNEPLRSLPGSIASVGILVAGLAGMSFFGAAAPGNAIAARSNAIAARKYEKVGSESPPSVSLRIQDAGSASNGSVNSNSNSIRGSSLNLLDPPCIWLSRRAYGLSAAVINGFLGGSTMVPLKVVSSSQRNAVLVGIDFVVSFAIGASIVTVGIWSCIAVWALWSAACENVPLPSNASSNSEDVSSNSVLSRAHARLPSLQFRVMALPGMWAGLLWAAGNFFSIVAVLHLGQAVGYSAVQASIIVSGLWGMFHFGEIQRGHRVAWIASATAATAGIMLLMYQRQK